ncbi:MAG: OmpH family outer membrane protein [Thermodesulfobacteriota bacterium]|nr:OmpH family outer membrane protein [Thermodesulfobacteriota bacterium]
MKKFVISMSVMALVCMGCCLPCFGADVAKIGVVDIQKFFKESDIGKAANAQVEKEHAKLKADLEAAAQDVQALEAELERDAMVMSEEKREEKDRAFRIKKYDFQVLQQKYSENLRKVNQEMLRKLDTKLTKLTQEFGTREGLLLMIEKGYTMYYPSAIDVTDKLIVFANSKNLTLDGE